MEISKGNKPIYQCLTSKDILEEGDEFRSGEHPLTGKSWLKIPKEVVGDLAGDYITYRRLLNPNGETVLVVPKS
jgi:hypothetical protein